MRPRFIFFSLLILLFLTTGCIRHGRGTNISFGFIFIPFSARASSEKVYMHDGHIHDEFCGHERRWYDGKWVYHYNGFWEYYDYEQNVYYYVPPELLKNDGK